MFAKSLEMATPLSDLLKFRGILSKVRGVVVSRGAATTADSRAPVLRCSGGFWRAYRPQAAAAASKKFPIWELHHYQREAVFAKSNTRYVVPHSEFSQRGCEITALARNINGWHLDSGSQNIVGLPCSLHRTQELTCRGVAVDTEFPICKPLRGKFELMDEALLNMAERSAVQQPSQSLNKSGQTDLPREQQSLAGGGSGNQSSGGEDGVAEGTAPANQTMTNRQKLKLFMRDYGSTVIVFHIAQSLTFLGIVYLAFSTGLDMAWIIQKLGLEGEHLNAAAGASTFVIAYTVYKFLAPLRFAITFSCTPFIVRYLRRIGFLKVK